MWVANEPNSNTSLSRQPVSDNYVGGMSWHSGLVDNIVVGATHLINIKYMPRYAKYKII